MTDAYGSDDTNIYDPDEGAAEKEQVKKIDQEPLFRIYEGSRIAVGRGVGIAWKNRYDAAKKAYELIYKAWDECFRYYNNNQTKNIETPRGTFTRADSTENIVFSNINIMLPAVYSKDPDITCSTVDEEDEPFCKALAALLNTLFRRRDKINAKPKVKKSVGMALLTNFGVLKLENIGKDDSRELAQEEMERITADLAKVTTPQEAEELYGELQALEQTIEVFKPSGPHLSNVLPHNLMIDPFAELPDGTDGNWMIERVFMQTSFILAKYTRPSSEDERDDERVYAYKPTHKASFAEGGNREDGVGLVFNTLDTDPELPESHHDAERQAFINMYFTECFLVWDKSTRRVMLYHRDDWMWPLWVWDDPMHLSRFFPYFISAFTMSTGGAVSVGEASYYLDQQDEVNDINRQVNRIRRSLFNFFYYNVDKVDAAEAEKFVNALTGKGDPGAKNILGVRAGDRKINELIEAFLPPSATGIEHFFNKDKILASIDRITNTSDALRGTQFKTNTNVASVNLYQESMRLSVGAKVDVVEDTVADIAMSLAEICIQTMDQAQVEGLIGKSLAAGWKEMDLATFSSTYNLALVAGSMEKPNSVFKKKEAVEISQAIGQFAQAAPGATLRIMLRVLEQAFTEIVIKPEDWAALDREVRATMQKGVSTEGAEGQEGASGPNALLEAARNLPPEAQQKIMELKQQGASPQEILQVIQALVQQQGGGQQQQPSMNGAANGAS